MCMAPLDSLRQPISAFELDLLWHCADSGVFFALAESREKSLIETSAKASELAGDRGFPRPAAEVGGLLQHPSFIPDHRR